MTKNRNSSPNENDGGTRVDLGDDLLAEGTVVLERSPTSSSILSSDPIHEVPADGPGSIEDLLQSAKILISEGLVDDAKKILRHILISDPSNAVAQQTLVEIQSLELKRIFDSEEVRRPFSKRGEQGMGEIDAEALMRQLDKDLNLGVFTENSPLAFQESVSLFQDNGVADALYQQLERNLSNSTTQDWIDLGIAFLEMELYGISIRLLMGASRHLRPDHAEYSQLALSCTCLLALALILAGRPFEAIARIQPIMQDVEIRRENKIELFYLMGRTYETMKKYDLAFRFYQQVMEIDPYYRDIDQRLRKKSY